MIDQDAPDPIHAEEINPAAEAATHTSATKPPLAQFLEHQINAAHETMQALEALVPPDFRSHSRAARREFLMSFKVLLDSAMTNVEHELNKARQFPPESKPPTPPTTTGKSKVKVEVS